MSWLAASGPAELLALQRVSARRVPAELRRTKRAPGDPEARLVEAAERAFQPLHVGKQVLFRHEHAVHDDLAGDGRAQAELALDRRCVQTIHAALKDEAANDAVELGPDNHHVGDRAHW